MLAPPHHDLYLQRDFTQPPHTGQTPTGCLHTNRQQRDPPTPREQPAVRHQPHSVSGCTRGCQPLPARPLTLPLQPPWAQPGGSPGRAGHPIPPAAPPQPCVNQEVEASQQFIFRFFFYLNTKRKHMHKPCVHPHSTQ